MSEQVERSCAVLNVADIASTLFFAPAMSTTWSLPIQSFTAALEAQWPDANIEVTEFPDGRPYVRFDIKGHQGFYKSDENLVIREQTPAEAADILAWFLGLLPQDAHIRFSGEIAAESGIRDDWWLPRDAGKQQITQVLIDHLVAVSGED